MSLLTKIQNKIRPILSDEEIVKYNQQKLLIVEPIMEEQLQPNSVDLTLRNGFSEVLPNSDGIIDPRYPVEYRAERFPTDDKYGEPHIILQPHKFYLLSSVETLNIPNGIVAFVQGRSSIARLGIQMEQAGLVDAGFRGTITFECYNETEYPVVLYPNMRVAQVYFLKSMHALSPYGLLRNSKYDGQVGPTGSKIYIDFFR